LGYSFAGLRTVIAQSAPRLTVDGECTAFAWAPDGRIVYATRHVFAKGKFDIQRDDLWLLGTDGSRQKIFDGQRYGHGSGEFSYTVTSLRWSPDGTRLTAQLRTSQLLNSKGGVQEDAVLLLLDQQGKQIRLRNLIAEVDGAVDGTWLAESGTVAYATAVSRTSSLLSLHVLRADVARSGDFFVGHAFSSVAWDAKRNAAIAIERSGGTGPPRITTLDLLHEDGRALATLDKYLGGHALSPNGDKVAYFLDDQTVEVRDIMHPQQVGQLHVAYGDIGWSSDESRLLIKRGEDRQDGDLVWVPAPRLADGGDEHADPEAQPVLHDVMFHSFAVSPDGKLIAVTQAGKRTLMVFDSPF
jgi:WD40 repeat protein